jgi:hypothetical protein
MLLVSWFSQPPEGLSSYYLYNTRTRQLCRIRLELGRASTGNNNTVISYDGGTVVGFGESGLLGPEQGGKWSVDGEYQLCFGGVPLAGPPPKNAGDGIYDAADDPGSVAILHSGNPVTKNPTLPAGIEPKHLAPLAQRAMLDKKDVTLTGSAATRDELADAIKAQVAEVLGVGNFGQVTDNRIHAKLTEQARDIATGPARASLVKMLDAARELINDISGALTEATIAPGPEVPVSSMLAAVGNAVNLRATARETLDQITTAQQAVKAVAQVIGADASQEDPSQEDEAEEDLLITDTRLLSTTMSHAAEYAGNWQASETACAPLTETTNVGAYMTILSGPDGQAVRPVRDELLPAGLQ